MITYLKGDATYPQGDGNKIIAHIVNDSGGWGAGFVLAISKRWKKPEVKYRQWKNSDDFRLGINQIVKVEDDISVANMLCQHGYSTPTYKAVDLKYLELCLQGLNDYATLCKATIHMPRIGCGLGGRSWDEIEKLITSNLEVEVFVYDLV